LTRALQLALFIGAFAAAVFVWLVPVQAWLWRSADGKVLVSAVPILPFILLPLVIRPLQRSTRIAWMLAAVMALDLVFLMIADFAPTGGHPSLEAMGSLFLGLAKPFLVLASIVLLSVAFLGGERLVVVALGFICLLAEALFALYPIDFLTHGAQ
jgi:hypothetical protein